MLAFRDAPCDPLGHTYMHNISADSPSIKAMQTFLDERLSNPPTATST